MVNTLELKAELRRNNITQDELANTINMNPATLNKKINNKAIFTVAEAQAIAKALNIAGERLIVIFFAPTLA